MDPTQVKDYFERVASEWDTMRLAMLDVERRNLGELGIHNVELRRAETADLPWSDNSVDGAVANMVLIPGLKRLIPPVATAAAPQTTSPHPPADDGRLPTPQIARNTPSTQ